MPGQGAAGLRVLFCNWVDPRDPARRGGGVAVYQRHLAPALAAAGIEATHLSAGLAHDLRPGPPRWQPAAGTGPGGRGPDGARHYQIVNSAVLAPGQASFGDPAQLADAATEAAFAGFLAATGPYDAVHFDNLEGFPARVLEVAARSGARVVAMLHNYYPFCPQVNLWQQERAACTDYRGGAACAACLPGRRAAPGLRRLNMALAWRLGPGWPRAVAALRAVRHRLRPGRAAAAGQAPAGQGAEPAGLGDGFARRRAGMVALLNRHCHAVLCVSDRVRVLAAGFGITPALLHTARIGSPEAGRFAAAPRPLLTPEGRIRLAYLGYMRRDKGFFFLLEALEALPAALAGRIELVLAAAAADRATLARVAALGRRLAGLRHVDGYAHADLDRILEGVTLGVVPVLWEDNLPQVALEMHLRRIPLLTSDLGGARELGNCPALTFPAGDAGALACRLQAVLERRIRAGDYWREARAPLDMAAHLHELLPHWRGS